MDQLLVNKIICPDGTVLESRHRHDYQEHEQEDGRVYLVDGGLDYQRIGFSDTEFTNCTYHVGDDHSKIREHFTWKSILDENGERLEQPIYRKLKDLTDAHIYALIEFTAEDYPQFINDLFIAEKSYREENN